MPAQVTENLFHARFQGRNDYKYCVFNNGFPIYGYRSRMIYDHRVFCLYTSSKQPFFIKNLITHFWNNFYHLCCTSYLKEANLEALVFWGFRSYIEIQFSNTFKSETRSRHLRTIDVQCSIIQLVIPWICVRQDIQVI